MSAHEPGTLPPPLSARCQCGHRGLYHAVTAAPFECFTCDCPGFVRALTEGDLEAAGQLSMLESAL